MLQGPQIVTVAIDEADQTPTALTELDPASRSALLAGLKSGAPAGTYAEFAPEEWSRLALSPAPISGRRIAAPVSLASLSTQDGDTPLPPPRPAEFSSRQQGATAELAEGKAASAAEPTDARGFLDKFFGVAQAASSLAAPSSALAYAAPDSALLDDARKMMSTPPVVPPSRFDQFTAVYEIATHTVHLPDGTKLEAHSGLGSRLDDPRFVHEKMRGATPPNLYELSFRESLFHGVRALRLAPVGEGTVFGRAGLLAHTYMLGPRGDSNGCVVFKNYPVFLKAFQSGGIKRLAVVSKLD
jgi:hypothetical protein